MRYQIELTPSGNIGVVIPSETGGEHVVEVPSSIEGVRLIKTILIARKYTPQSKIGSPAAPVASDIMKFLADKQTTPRPAPRENLPPKIIKRPLAKDLEGLELDI